MSLKVNYEENAAPCYTALTYVHSQARSAALPPNLRT
jgi:hypothetical protein